jgi:hypothetical protein
MRLELTLDEHGRTEVVPRDVDALLEHLVSGARDVPRILTAVP